MNKRQRKKRAKKEKRLKPLKDFFKNFWSIMEQATRLPKELLRGDAPHTWVTLKSPASGKHIVMDYTKADMTGWTS